MVSVSELQQLPESPGVYLMRNAEGKILYIGKANNILGRVRSHFSGGHASHQLYSRVCDIDFIVTQNEIEALLLENAMIKENLPKYNVRLKDDKRYPYLKLTLNETFPQLHLTRKLPKKGEGKRDRAETGARFFGPFPDVRGAKRLLKTLQEIFPLRTCRIPSANLRLDRPCLEFEMHRCVAPCVTSICGQTEYRSLALKVKRFLDGDHKAVADELARMMDEAAEDLSFEKAAVYRDAIEALRNFSERQAISLLEEDAEDYLGAAQVGDVACVVVMRRRGGSIRGSEHYFLEAEVETGLPEILGAFVAQHYEAAPEIPRRLLCSHEPLAAEAMEVWLTGLLSKKVTIRRPHRGPRVRLVEMASKNAEVHAAEQYRKRHGGKRKIAQNVIRLGTELKLNSLPIRIEGYDISHHRGEEPVASMVVFENGAPKKSDYRRFKIKTAKGGDDFRSIEEVITRRFLHEEPEFGPLPDLVMIDGGPVQLAFARTALDAVAGTRGEPLRTRLIDQPMVSLAKREEEIYLPGVAAPLMLDLRHEGLKLLQQVRDEAHRFAITFHRKRKAVERQTSALAVIPGIGPAKVERLLIHFGSVEKIAEASVAEIAEVRGITEPLAQEVLRTARTVVEPFGEEADV